MKKEKQLISRIHLIAYLDKILSSAKQEIKVQSEISVLKNSEEEFVEYLVNKFSVEPLIIDYDNSFIVPSNRPVPANFHPRRYHVEEGRNYNRDLLIFKIRYSGDSILLSCPTTKLDIYSDEIWRENNYICYEIINFDYNKEQIETKINRFLL